MKKNTNKQHIIAIVAAIDLLLLDLVTKFLVRTEFYKPATFIKDFFYLTDIQTNSGIAFGIKMPLLVQIVGSLIILVVLFRFAQEYVFGAKKHKFLKPFLFGIIMGGAVGNLIERIVKGYVVDFIVLKPIPVFNLADVGITIGLILLFLIMLTEPKTN
ncbi:signal peptidase II [Patescibacteria group bacterium]|nr:signal peptidase II [Patescibacteria group bacterium]